MRSIVDRAIEELRRLEDENEQLRADNEYLTAENRELSEWLVGTVELSLRARS